MMVGMLALWVLIVGGVVWLTVWLTRQGQTATGRGGANRALDILSERYVRGEISREQYEQMRRDLKDR